MKRSKWFNPYMENGKGKLVTSLKDCWTCAQAGVYFIRHIQTESIVYVGSSTTQLKKTIYRHFQEWNDRQPGTGRQFERKTYPKKGYYQVRFIKCTADQALKLEKAFIIKLQPKDNPLKYDNLSRQQIEAGKKLLSEANAAPQLTKDEYLEEAPF